MPPSNEPPSGQIPRQNVADVLGAVALLIFHGVLFTATFLALGYLSITRHPCYNGNCGGGRWVERGLLLGVWGGGAILLADATVTVFRLVRNRVAWPIPLSACIAQLVLGLIAASMQLLAGAGPGAT
jgi:hypothetical protein